MSGVSSPLHVVQITDLHLKSVPSHLWGADVDAGLNAVLAHIRKRDPAPDFILATGDLIGDEPEAYPRLREILASVNIPVYCLPGNHDFPFSMEQMLRGSWVRRERYLPLGSWQILLLDSSFPGTPVGHLATTELTLLDTVLATTPDCPTLVCLHHNPLPVGTAWMDTMMVVNGEALFNLLSRYSQVRAIIFGHIHAEFAAQRGTIQIFGTPATCMQFKPNVPDPEIDDLPPGYRWLTLYPDGTLETGVERVNL